MNENYEEGGINVDFPSYAIAIYAGFILTYGMKGSLSTSPGLGRGLTRAGSTDLDLFSNTSCWIAEWVERGL